MKTVYVAMSADLIHPGHFQEINEERLANNPRKLDIKKIKQIVSNIQ